MCTAQDPILMTFKTTVITRWPELREQVPIPIREYWLYRDEISVHNGVLFKNHHRLFGNPVLEGAIQSPRNP